VTSGFDYSVVVYSLSIYAAIVMSPGPNFALVSRLALQGRKRKSTGAILGLASAATFYAILAMAGLSALLSEIGWLARAVQIGGGAYLIYLGLQAWVSSFSKQPETSSNGHSVEGDREFLGGLKLGILVNLSNPKGIAFFVSLYAVAVPFDASMATRLSVLLGGAALELGWYNIVVSLLSRSAAQAAYKRFSNWIERAIGSALILFGGKLVLDR